MEIKCPYNSTVHLKTLMQGHLPDEYKWQVQGQLMVLDREFCDFISYDPRMKDEANRMRIIRVERDPAMFEQLHEKLEAFVTEMNATIDRIRDSVVKTAEAEAAASV